MWPPCLCFLVDKGHFLSPNSAILKLVWVFWLIESEVVNNTGIGLRWTWLNCCYRYKEFLWAWISPAIIWVVSFASCAVWCEENDLNQFSWKCKEFPLLYFTLTDFITKIFKCFNCSLHFHWKKLVWSNIFEFVLDWFTPCWCLVSSQCVTLENFVVDARVCVCTCMCILQNRSLREQYSTKEKQFIHFQCNTNKIRIFVFSRLENKKIWPLSYQGPCNFYLLLFKLSLSCCYTLPVAS